jgi:hypothetical protein
MIDTIQLVLLLVIVVLAIFLLVIGVQVFFILKDFRRTISKFNRVLDNTEFITNNISKPLSSLSGLASGFRAGGSIFTVVKLIKTLVGSDEDERKGNKE